LVKSEREAPVPSAQQSMTGTARNEQKVAIQFIDQALSKLPFQVDNGQEFGSVLHWCLLDMGHRTRQYPVPERQSRALASH